MNDEMMKKSLKDRVKNALSITVSLPVEMKDEDTKEKEEDQAVDRPPKLDDTKEDKEAIMNGSERDMERRKGEKPRGLRDRVRMSMVEKE